MSIRFKRHLFGQNPIYNCGAIGIESWTISHRFAVIFAPTAPHQRWRRKPCNGLLTVLSFQANLVRKRLIIYFIWEVWKRVQFCKKSVYRKSFSYSVMDCQFADFRMKGEAEYGKLYCNYFYWPDYNLCGTLPFITQVSTLPEPYLLSQQGGSILLILFDRSACLNSEGGQEQFQCFWSVPVIKFKRTGKT